MNTEPLYRGGPVWREMHVNIYQGGAFRFVGQAHTSRFTADKTLAAFYRGPNASGPRTLRPLYRVVIRPHAMPKRGWGNGYGS